MNPANGWETWSRHVLAELGRLDASVRDLRATELAHLQRDMRQVLVDVTVLKTKAAVWGGLAGAVFSLAVAALVRLLNAGH